MCFSNMCWSTGRIVGESQLGFPTPRAKCGDLWGNLTVGAWCCRPWCYASADCPDAYQSQAIPGQFFSHLIHKNMCFDISLDQEQWFDYIRWTWYNVGWLDYIVLFFRPVDNPSLDTFRYWGYAACNSYTTPPPAQCPWVAVAAQNDPCKCLSVGSLFNNAMKNKFALTYGSSCAAWDMTNCATNYRADQVDSWCCASWCYVDKSCPSAKDSLNDGMQGILYWSDNACPDDTALTLQCPYRPMSNNTPAGDCTCLTEKVPSTVMNWDNLGLNSTTYADYGTSCLPWDSQECEKLYPSLSSYAMWCCLSWCWVGETCATARASTLWPGHFFSISTLEHFVYRIHGSDEGFCDAKTCKDTLRSARFEFPISFLLVPIAVCIRCIEAMMDVQWAPTWSPAASTTTVASVEDNCLLAPSPMSRALSRITMVAASWHKQPVNS